MTTEQQRPSIAEARDALRDVWEALDVWRAKRIARGAWSTVDELEYHQAIAPLARVVHPETA